MQPLAKSASSPTLTAQSARHGVRPGSRHASQCTDGLLAFLRSQTCEKHTRPSENSVPKKVYLVYCIHVQYAQHVLQMRGVDISSDQNISAPYPIFILASGQSRSADRCSTLPPYLSLRLVSYRFCIISYCFVSSPVVSPAAFLFFGHRNQNGVGMWTSPASRILRRLTRSSRASHHRLLSRSSNSSNAKAAETASRRFA